MAASTAAALVALLAALCCPTAAHKEEPWPSCDLLYNWYWCRGHHEGGIICDSNIKRGSIEPVAVLWTRNIETGNSSHVPEGQNDFGLMYQLINYAGHLKLSLRYCSKAERTLSESPDYYQHKDKPRCKENWYNCDLVDDRISCQLRLCPWSDEPLLPTSGKASDWYGCTKVGDQIDCYLSNLGERKIYHPKKTHKKVHKYLPYHEYDGMELKHHSAEFEHHGLEDDFGEAALKF